jgi:1,4-alpha-glucan branching enzyme
MKSTKTKTKSIASALLTKPIASPVPSVPLKLVAPSAKTVAVAGSFNDWQPSATLLKPARAGEWKGELSLPPGRHEYLFVVDGQWLPDPAAREAVPNPFGGVNSVISIG